MALWPLQRGCAVGWRNIRIPRPQRSEWPSGLSRGAAQWGGGISEYLAHSDQNGPLASPEGLLRGVAEYPNTSPTAIRMALWPPQRGCSGGWRNIRIPRPQRSEWPSGLPRGVAQGGGGISEYLAHSDQNGPLASPEGLLRGVAEYPNTSPTAIRMALWPPQR